MSYPVTPRPFERYPTHNSHQPQKQPKGDRLATKIAKGAAATTLGAVPLALSQGMIPYAKAGIQYFLENPVKIVLGYGAIYVSEAIYEEYGEAQILDDENAFLELSQVTLKQLQAFNDNDAAFEKFRRQIEDALKRLKPRDPDRYENAKHHYRSVLQLCVKEREKAFSWANDQFNVRHRYHLPSQGLEHGKRVARAAAKGFAYQHVPGFRVRNYDPARVEHDYRREREKAFREEFEIPRSPPRSPPTSRSCSSGSESTDEVVRQETPPGSRSASSGSEADDNEVLVRSRPSVALAAPAPTSITNSICTIL